MKTLRVGTQLNAIPRLTPSFASADSAVLLQTQLSLIWYGVS
jgi:hypothetical protein